MIYTTDGRKTKTLGTIRAREGRSGATWRRERKQEENQVGARHATPGYNHERDGDVEHAAGEERQERARCKMKRTRKDDQVGALSMSEKSRAVPRGAEREKRTFPRGRDLHIPRGH